jgi:PAS domain S-box-containing protein
LATAVYGLLGFREDRAAATAFALNAQKRGEAVQHAVRDTLAAVRPLAAFFASSQFVDRGEFHIFANSLRADLECAEALGWVRWVDPPHRESHEETARSEDLSGYRIRQRGADGQLVPATERDEYYPIYYLEPDKAFPDGLGYDLGMHPEAVAVMRGAAATGALTAAPMTSPLGPASDRYVLFAAAPVYEGKAVGVDVDRRHSDLDGFVVGWFWLDTAIGSATRYLGPAGLDTYLFDTVEGRARRLHVEPSRPRPATHALLDAPPPANVPGLSWSHTFDAGDHRWTVCCLADPQYLAPERTWVPAATLAAGLLLSALIGGYLLLLTRQAADIERLAARRTTELHTITSVALDAMIMIDPQGKVVHWNPAAERIFGYAREEILGRSAHQTLTPPRLRADATAGFERFATAGTGRVVGQVLELTALRHDGSEIPIEISVAPFRQPDGWWAVAIVRDITRRKHAEEALEKERRLLRQMLNLLERDRKLVAYEIHDGMAQDLTGAILKLQGLRSQQAGDPATAEQSLADLEKSVRSALAEARRLIGGLRPPVLDASGVVAAVEFLVAEHRQRSGIEIEFAHQVRFHRLAQPLEVALFRVVQESLTNACRYSRSPRVRVELTQLDEHTVRVEVRDWGVGFDPGQIEPGHFGVQGIRERARLFGGQATIDSSPGQGTRVVVELPLVAVESPSDDEEE